jgi:hypothetical protein
MHESPEDSLRSGTQQKLTIAGPENVVKTSGHDVDDILRGDWLNNTANFDGWKIVNSLAIWPGRRLESVQSESLNKIIFQIFLLKSSLAERNKTKIRIVTWTTTVSCFFAVDG